MNHLPRLLHHLAELFLGDHDREAVTGDLVEMFSEKAARHGCVRAGAWVLIEILALAVRSASRWLRTDHRFLQMVVAGAVGGALFLGGMESQGPRIVPLFATFLLLVGVLIARTANTPFRIRFALLFTVYVSWLLFTLLVFFVAGETKVLREPGATLRWFLIYFPLMLLIGAIGSFSIALFSTRKRRLALLIAAMPLWVLAVHDATRTVYYIPLVIKVVLPFTAVVGALKISAVRNWSLLADVLLWAAIAHVVMRKLRLESRATTGA